MRRITLAALLCAVLSPANAEATHTAVSLEDVILLAQSGISDETILTFLNSREIGLVLTPEDVARLRDAGVSEEIIRYLLERTGPRAEDAPYYAVPVGSGYAYPPGYYASYYDPWATSLSGGLNPALLAA